MTFLKINLTFVPRPLKCALRPLLAFALLALPASAAFPNGYNYCKVVTTQSTMVSGAADLSNYPLTLILTDADLKSVANGGLVNHNSGYDIAFYPDCSGAGVALKWEMESYSPATGAIVAHVLRPTLSHTDNDTLGMYYGGSQTTFQSTPSAVWDPNFKGIWHFSEDSGTTVSDSEVAAHNGTATRSSILNNTGKIGKGGSFVRSSSDRVTLTDDVDLRPTTFTASMWVKRNSAGGGANTMSLFLSGEQNSFWAGFGLQFGLNDKIRVAPGDGTDPLGQEYYGAAAHADTTSWHYVAVSMSGTSLAIYYDGVADGTATSAKPVVFKALSKPAMGATSYGGVWYHHLDGLLDEVRLSNTVRSADWILTEYRNQSAPGAYISAGPRTTPAVQPARVRHTVRGGV